MEWMNQKFNAVDNRITFCLAPEFNSSILPIDIAIKTVKSIVKNNPAPYTLLVGSSILDQAMIFAWSKSGHRFFVVQPKFNDDVADGWGASLRAFAKKLRVAVYAQYFDIKTFLDIECFNWSNSFRSTSPEVCAQFKMLSAIKNGTVILSGSILDSEIPALTYDNLGLMRYKVKYMRSIIPFFFLENKELAFAFWSLMKNLDSNLQQCDKMAAVLSLGGFEIDADTNDRELASRIKEFYGKRLEYKILEEDRYLENATLLDKVFKIPLNRKFKNPTVEFKILDSLDINKN